MGQKVDQLCVVCHDLGQEPAASEPGCFAATLIDEGRYDPITTEAAQTPDSQLLLNYPTEDGLVTTARYTLTTDAGMPVTTQAIADLCGGLTPYLWRPKNMAWAASPMPSTVPDHFTDATFVTSDHVAYSWISSAGTSGDFGWSGSRTEIMRVHGILAANEQYAQEAVTRWLATDGQWCASYCDVSAADVAAILPNAYAANGCPGEGAISTEETIYLADIEPWLNKNYFRHGEAYVPITYCPTDGGLVAGTMMQFDQAIDAITVFPKTVAWSREAEDPRTVFAFNLAHEFGHARHDIISGTSATLDLQWSSMMGLPMATTVAVATALQDRQVGAMCSSAFIRSLRQTLGLDAANEYTHSPAFKGELIAELYALDYVFTLSQLGMITRADRALLLDHVDWLLGQAFATLVGSYTLFPSNASDLETLYWTVAFDPALSSMTKQVGLSHIIGMARALPPEARRRFIAGGDPPVRCDTPDVLTAFSNRARPFFEVMDEWCYTFDEAVNRPKRSQRIRPPMNAYVLTVP